MEEAGLTARKLWGSACVCFPSTGVVSTHYHVQCFYMSAGNPLVWQTTLPLETLPQTLRSVESFWQNWGSDSAISQGAVLSPSRFRKLPNIYKAQVLISRK